MLKVKDVELSEDGYRVKLIDSKSRKSLFTTVEELLGNRMYEVVGFEILFPNLVRFKYTTKSDTCVVVFVKKDGVYTPHFVVPCIYAVGDTGECVKCRLTKSGKLRVTAVTDGVAVESIDIFSCEVLFALEQPIIAADNGAFDTFRNRIIHHFNSTKEENYV